MVWTKFLAGGCNWECCSTVLLIFVDAGFINFTVDNEWKELLKLLLMTTVAAYFGGRSYEKGQKIKTK